MNWLAHLLLSEPEPAFRIGNLLPDLLPAGSLKDLPLIFLGGVTQHRRIDAFTDAHPIMRRSMQRLGPTYRRFAGILTDVFYDHFLSCAWADYCSAALPDFVADFFEGVERHRCDLPAEACATLGHIRRAGWLCSYGSMDGLSDVLRRMGARFRKPCDLASSLSVFQQHYDALRADFDAFFPELISHVMPPSSRPVATDIFCHMEIP